MEKGILPTTRLQIISETVLVLGIALVASLTAINYDAFERFCALVRDFEHAQLDELFIAALVFSLAFCFLFIRRETQLRKQMEAVEMQRMAALSAAYEDDLTKLPNRRAFIEELSSASGSAEEEIAVLMLDLDGFKSVNDSLGHDAGDAVLQSIADRLRSAVGDGDGTFVARLGGDEFACIVQIKNGDQAPEQLAEAIVRAVSAPIPECAGMPVGVSVGIAAVAGGEDVDEIMREADAAMYSAKRYGGSCYISAGSPETVEAKAVA